MNFTLVLLVLASFPSRVDSLPGSISGPVVELLPREVVTATTMETAATESTSPAPPSDGKKDDVPGSPFSRLTLNGYLNQGYAETDGNQLFGIPEEGTTDYRVVALQFRYDLSSRSSIIAQLASEKVGKSPGEALRNDVEVDRVYFQHWFSNRTRLRVGRVAIPIGIFNEYRDVGTLFPFYRPAASIYGEAGSVTISAESLDGLTISRVFGDRESWHLESTLYTGEWESGQPQGDFIVVTRAEDAIGLSTWLGTPLPGLRIGFGLNRFELVGSGGRAGAATEIETTHVSLEALFERFLVRGEYFSYDFDGGFYDAYYGQAGIKVTHHLGIYLQIESADLRFTIPFVGGATLDINDDVGLAVDYTFSSGLVVKLEHHWNEGFLSEDPLPSFLRDPFETTYSIVSMAVAF